MVKDTKATVILSERSESKDLGTHFLQMPL